MVGTTDEMNLRNSSKYLQAATPPASMRSGKQAQGATSAAARARQVQQQQQKQQQQQQQKQQQRQRLRQRPEQQVGNSSATSSRWAGAAEAAEAAAEAGIWCTLTYPCALHSGRGRARGRRGAHSSTLKLLPFSTRFPTSFFITSACRQGWMLAAVTGTCGWGSTVMVLRAWSSLTSSST